LEVSSVRLVAEIQLLVLCLYVICSVLVVSCGSVLSVSTVHVLCCCMWLEFRTCYLTVCELGMLWWHLIGMKEKLVAFLTLTPFEGECSNVSILLGNHFHP
jgi:hypothetical protein